MPTARVSRNPILAAIAIGCLAPVATASDHVVYVEAVVREGQLVGYTVGSVTQMRAVRSISALAGNWAGGFAAVIETEAGGLTGGEPESLLGVGPRWLSHVYGAATLGAPAMVLSEATIGGLEQCWYGPLVAINDAGTAAVSARLLGAPFGFRSSLWSGASAQVVQGDAAPSNSGYYWRYAGQPHLTASGSLYWLGGLADDSTFGSPTVLSGFFTGTSATPVLLGGATITGLPADLVEIDAVGPASAVASGGGHFLVAARMDMSSTSDEVLVFDGSGLEIGATLVREGNTVEATGALTAETWAQFDHLQVNNTGEWAIAARTIADSTAYTVLVQNEDVVHRSGQVIDGKSLGDAVFGIALNNDGDVVSLWRLADLQGQGLLLNDLLLLKRGDAIDLNGDGTIDPEQRISEFARFGAITLSDRSAGTLPSVFIHVLATVKDHDTGAEIDAVLRLEARPGGPTCASIDYDEDGLITAADFDLFSDLFDNFDPLADLDGDSFVDITDFLIFVELFSSCV